MKRPTQELSAVSLFSGAGGMDVGFTAAGYRVLWANDLDPVACETYKLNHSSPIVCASLSENLDLLNGFKGADVVFGGPPCQGFSVAGKMNPDDERSQLLWIYLNAVERVQPSAFVCENVKALGTLEKWKPVREKFLREARRLGYRCSFTVLNASHYGVPQGRERVFFIGIRDGKLPDLSRFFLKFRCKTPTVREAIASLGRAGTPKNSRICRAKITLAATPVMRRTAYAGMLFNGLGRPVKLDGFSATLPASMGGNKTPIIDEAALHDGLEPWVDEYHQKLMNGAIPQFGDAPARLRRLTVDEAIRIQTFPHKYQFAGGTAAIFRQIGNAVPCKLAEVVARGVSDILKGKSECDDDCIPTSQQIDFLNGLD